MSEQIITVEQLVSERSAGIGSSDIGSLFSADHGCALRLYRQKRNEKPDNPFHGNKHTARGHALEDDAAELYATQTGRLLQVQNTLRDPEHKYLIGHPDRIIRSFDERGDGILEIKCPGRDSFEKIMDGGISDTYKLQMQWLTGLSSLQWGDFAILDYDNWKAVPFRVEFDRDLFQLARERAIDFWNNNVLAGIAPEKLPATDPRCHDCAYLRSCQGEHMLQLSAQEVPAIDSLPFDESLAPLVDEIEERKQLVAEAEQMLSQSEEKLKQALGDRQAVDTIGARIYFKVQERATIQGSALLKRLSGMAIDAASYLDAPPFDTQTIDAHHEQMKEQTTLIEEIEGKYMNRSISRPLRIYLRNK